MQTLLTPLLSGGKRLGKASFASSDDDYDDDYDDDFDYLMIIMMTRSLGALRAPTSSWRPFGPLDFVFRAHLTILTIFDHFGPY